MPARLIVFEKTGRWGAALRRAAGRRELPMVEVRSLEQAQRELDGHVGSVVALEIHATSAASVLAKMTQWRRRHWAARFVLLAEGELESAEALLREAGAVSVVYSPRHLDSTVRLIRRCLARAPRPQMSWEDTIWARLPWANRSPSRS